MNFTQKNRAPMSPATSFDCSFLFTESDVFLKNYISYSIPSYTTIKPYSLQSQIIHHINCIRHCVKMGLLNILILSYEIRRCAAPCVAGTIHYYITIRGTIRIILYKDLPKRICTHIHHCSPIIQYILFCHVI